MSNPKTRATRRGQNVELGVLPSREQLTAPQAVASVPSLRNSVQLSEAVDDESAAFGSTLERTATAIAAQSKSRTAAVIASVTLITAISTLLNGVTTVALPVMAKDLSIADNILFW